MKIGKIDISKPVLLAPMEDVTDRAFRIICKRQGADIVYTEFVNSDGLVRQNFRTREKMSFQAEERPVGIQIYGSEEGSMAGAAIMAEELEPEIIDINCGCWVRKVVGRTAGSGLLRDLPRMKRIISSVVRSVSTPVTVKTRLGWDSDSIRIVEVAKMVEDAGAQALTVHCRTRAQGHKGDPDYRWIPDVKQAVGIPVIVNGGIDSPEAAKRIFDTTGCDGVMVARAAIQNPWIFGDIKEYLRTGGLIPERTLEQRIEMLLKHLRLAIGFKGERRAVLEFRKYYSGYLRGHAGIVKLRMDLMNLTEFEGVAAVLTRYLERQKTSPESPQGDPIAA